MLKNYFLIALRTLQRNLGYSLINIVGLSVGLACSMLIFFWVADEMSYDKFHTNYDNLYKVQCHFDYGDGVVTGHTLPYPLKDAIQNSTTGVKHILLTKWAEGSLLTAGEKRSNQMGLSVSEDFLKMFTFPLLKGDPATALNDPSSIVLTQTTATLLFGDKDPINELVKVDNDQELKVTGVVQDPPRQSTITFDFLTTFAYYEATQPWVQRSRDNWQNNSFQFYVELEPTASLAEVNNSIKGLIHGKSEYAKKSEVFLYPMGKLRLHNQFKNGKPNGGLIEYVQVFSAIAVFILVIACINFMNLATARSESRAREVGIRKTIGSRRKQLIFQFIGESLIITTIAFIISVVLIELALPAYNLLVHKNIHIEYTNPVLWAIAFALIMVTGFFAGSYPAFYLSSFSPAKVLKGKLVTSRSSTTPRKIMVTLQFVFSIVLIVATLVMYQQVTHLKKRDVGYNRENLMLIWSNEELNQNFDALRQELVNTGVVESVTKSNSPITKIFSSNLVEWPGMDADKKISFTTIATEYDYTKTMGIKMIEGRDFSRDVKSDSSAVVINQAALDLMGLSNPIGEHVKMHGTTWSIIGVMENVIMESPDRSIDPLIMMFDPSWTSTISLRLSKTDDLSASIEKISPIFNKLNPANPFEYYFADSDFSKKFSTINMIGRLAGIFAGLAIAITALGLFGLAAFTAQQRTKEFGIRKIMGASVYSIVALISRDFSRIVFIAFVFAAPLSWWLMTNFLERYPYRITISWWLLPAAGLFTLIMALAIVSAQALKAALTNPATSLRND